MIRHKTSQRTTLGAAILPLLWAAHAAFAQGATGGNCDAAVGTWHWFTDAQVEIARNGELRYNHRWAGQWSCEASSTRIGRGTLILKWSAAGLLDAVALDPSGTQLQGGTQGGIVVAAYRM